MSFKAKLKGYRAPLCAALICSAMIADTFAQAGGRPLILDTQTGIQSGAGGTVLQTGPLNGQGMVPARPLATLPEVSAQQGQQPDCGFALYRSAARRIQRPARLCHFARQSVPVGFSGDPWVAFFSGVFRGAARHARERSTPCAAAAVPAIARPTADRSTTAVSVACAAHDFDRPDIGRN